MQGPETGTLPQPEDGFEFAAPDGLRFDRTTRSWQPFVGSPPSSRRRRVFGDLILVAWSGGLLFLVAFDLLSISGR